MKNKIFCMLCMVGMFTFVAAQENERIIKVDTEGTCKTIPVSHWSIGIKTGASKYLMPPVSPTEYDRLNLMYGGMVEYTFNPFIGIGIECDHNDYSRPYTYTRPTTHIVSKGNLRGGTNDYIVYGSVNLSNAFAPFRSGFWKYLNIYGDIGGGIAFYHYALDKSPLSTKEAMMAKFGLNAEFTLSNVFNLCFAGQYNQYDALHMAKSTAHKNCDAYLCTLALRYKIGSSKSKHVRNLNRCDYAYKPIPVVRKKTYMKGETEESLNRLKKIELENVAINQTILKMEEEIKNATISKEKPSEDLTLQQKLQKMEEDLRQLSTQKEGVVSLSFENIEFKSNSNILVTSSYAILNQIASILKSNTLWYGVRISGHTDNIGSNDSNLKLSESRAFSVKKYLVSKGIPNHKIVTAGCGETEPVATNDTPEGRQKNRWVEFEIY